jgi:hypothetical protein
MQLGHFTFLPRPLSCRSVSLEPLYLAGMVTKGLPVLSGATEGVLLRLRHPSRFTVPPNDGSSVKSGPSPWERCPLALRVPREKPGRKGENT